MIPIPEVNYVAILGAAIVSMIIGFIWYHPRVLGNRWMAGTGKKKEEMGNPKVAMIGGFIASLIMMWVFAQNLVAWQALNALEGAMGGFFLWLGFIATTMTMGALFEGQKKSYWAINAFYYLVVLLINGALLTSF